MQEVDIQALRTAEQILGSHDFRSPGHDLSRKGRAGREAADGGHAGNVRMSHYLEGLQENIPNTSNLPMEAIEMGYPLHVEEYSTCGLGERFPHPPWGVFGGKPRASGRFLIHRGGKDGEELPAKVTGIAAASEMAIVAETAGARGYEEPYERPVDDVRRERCPIEFLANYEIAKGK